MDQTTVSMQWYVPWCQGFPNNMIPLKWMGVWNQDLFQDKVLSVWFGFIRVINLEINSSSSSSLQYHLFNKHTFLAFILLLDQ